MSVGREACEHPRQPDLSVAALRTARDQARSRAAQAGVRWTPQRERALEMLLEANGPVKAYDLIAHFQPGGKTAPPTVYRALDTLVQLGVAHRIASRSAYIARRPPCGEAALAAFLLCDCCGAVEEIDDPLPDVAEALRAQSDYQLTSFTVEAHGRCSRCRG